eukprot:COSAG06_NODE_16820_length_978_cov_7.025028_1_plen_67_part_00
MTENAEGGGLEAGGGGTGGRGGRVRSKVVTLLPSNLLVLLQYCAFMQYGVPAPTVATTMYLHTSGL